MDPFTICIIKSFSCNTSALRHCRSCVFLSRFSRYIICLSGLELQRQQGKMLNVRCRGESYCNYSGWRLHSLAFHFGDANLCVLRLLHESWTIKEKITGNELIHMRVYVCVSFFICIYYRLRGAMDLHFEVMIQDLHWDNRSRNPFTSVVLCRRFAAVMQYPLHGAGKGPRLHITDVIQGKCESLWSSTPVQWQTLINFH